MTERPGQISGFGVRSWNRGLQVVSYPLDPRTEKHVPADFIFIDRARSKIFGFQYKALYHNRKEHWRLSLSQHRTLSRYRWIFYGLSELRRPSDYKLGLHMLRIVRVGDIPPPSSQSSARYRVSVTSIRHYRKWGSFFERFRACKLGRKIRSLEDLHRFLPRELAEALGDLFIVDFEARKALRLSRYIGRK